MGHVQSYGQTSPKRVKSDLIVYGNIEVRDSTGLTFGDSTVIKGDFRVEGVASNRTIVVPYGAVMTVDFSKSNEYRIGSLTGDGEIVVSNVVEGATFTLEIPMDATGGHSITKTGWGTEADNTGSVSTDADDVTIVQFKMTSKGLAHWINTVAF